MSTGEIPSNKQPSLKKAFGEMAVTLEVIWIGVQRGLYDFGPELHKQLKDTIQLQRAVIPQIAKLP